MVDKYNDLYLPEAHQITEIDQELIDLATTTSQKVDQAMDHFQFSNALEEIWNLIRRSNKYIDETTPWILAKNEEDRERLDTVLYNLVESLRIISILIKPFISHTSDSIRKALNLKTEVKWDDANTWGLSQAGEKLKKIKALFPRLDIEKEIERLDEANHALAEKRQAEKATWQHEAGGENKEDKKEENSKEKITIDDFSKVEIKTALIEEVEDHPNADRLYVLKVKIGDERRQIVTNIKSQFSKEYLKGKKIMVVTNLKPMKFRGLESDGMILAAEDKDGKISLATTFEDLADGTIVG